MKILIMFISLLVSNVSFSETIIISTTKSVIGYKKGEFRGYTFLYPKNYSTELFDKNTFVLRKEKKLVSFITFSDQSIQSFQTRREYLLNEINHSSDTQQVISKARYKKDDDFYILLEHFKEQKENNKNIVASISSPENDDFFKISFLIDDKELIMNVIKSFRLK
jgi:hypothetical protein